MHTEHIEEISRQHQAESDQLDLTAWLIADPLRQKEVDRCMELSAKLARVKRGLDIIRVQRPELYKKLEGYFTDL
jgi:hypothetical protein